MLKTLQSEQNVKEQGWHIAGTQNRDQISKNKFQNKLGFFLFFFKKRLEVTLDFTQS